MNVEPIFTAKDGRILRRGVNQDPISAERLLASLRRDAKNPRDPLRHHMAALADELEAAIRATQPEEV